MPTVPLVGVRKNWNCVGELMFCPATRVRLLVSRGSNTGAPAVEAAPAPSDICCRRRARESGESYGANVTVSLASGTATGAFTPWSPTHHA